MCMCLCMCVFYVCEIARSNLFVQVGDVMGVGYIHATREIFFTHNGRFLGVVAIAKAYIPPAPAISAHLSRTTPAPSAAAAMRNNNLDVNNVAAAAIGGGNIAPVFANTATHAVRAAQLRGPHYFAIGMRSVGEKILVSACANMSPSSLSSLFLHLYNVAIL